MKDDSCQHSWKQDLWMSAHTIDPKVENTTGKEQPRPVPLERCISCGALKLPTGALARPRRATGS